LKTFTSKCSTGKELLDYVLNSKSRTYNLLPVHERITLKQLDHIFYGM